MAIQTQIGEAICRPTRPPNGYVERLRNQLLPMIAHELRQPLNAILLAVETEDGPDYEMTAQEARELCRREARHISQIIDNVLDTYRDANGSLRLHLVWVDLASVVHDAIETVRSVILSRGHRISLSLPPDSVGFVGDPVRLIQILTNLLTNSARYTPPGGHIYLNADSSSEVITIRVRDNGRGISPELLPHIFDPCERLAGAPPGGLGLGLAVVKSLVESHGGNVVAQSEGLNEGSEFTINLPARGPDSRANHSNPEVDNDLLDPPGITTYPPRTVSHCL